MTNPTPDPLLPELMRSLRSLGAQRDQCSDAANTAVFIPLLEARGRASAPSKRAVLAALRGASLITTIETGIVGAAVAGVEQPARVRALTAAAHELFEPLRVELLALDVAAQGAVDSDPLWDAWLGRLRRVFSVADDTCQALARLIADRGTLRASPGWFQRRTR